MILFFFTSNFNVLASTLCDYFLFSIIHLSLPLYMQYVEVVPPMDKQRRLEQILRDQERGSKVIIFCSTKKMCDQLARGIGRSFNAVSIHGDKSQVERDNVLDRKSVV